MRQLSSQAETIDVLYETAEAQAEMRLATEVFRGESGSEVSNSSEEAIEPMESETPPVGVTHNAGGTPSSGGSAYMSALSSSSMDW